MCQACSVRYGGRVYDVAGMRVRYGGHAVYDVAGMHV